MFTTFVDIWLIYKFFSFSLKQIHGKTKNKFVFINYSQRKSERRENRIRYLGPEP